MKKEKCPDCGRELCFPVPMESGDTLTFKNKPICVATKSADVSCCEYCGYMKYSFGKEVDNLEGVTHD